VTGKAGIKSYYGTTLNSRQHDPDDGSRVFKWCLDRVEDTNGNYMTINYTRDGGETYLQRIDYTGNGGLSPANAVIFYLEDRFDFPSMYTANFEVMVSKRLKTIEIRGNGEAARAYAFFYEENQNTSHSLMTHIDIYGSDVDIGADGTVLKGSRLPGIDIEYQASALGAADEVWIDRPVSSSEGRYEGGYGDFNGDGKTDYAYRQRNTNTFHVMISTGQIPDLVSKIENGLGNLSETAFSYSGGLFDLESREFRGFETVNQRSAVGTPYETVTRTKFHQDEFRKGRQYQVELREPGEPEVLLSKTTFTWERAYLDSPENSYAFVKLLEKRSELYDDVTVSSKEDYTYDDGYPNASRSAT
jgi:hypothetical protein